MRRRPHPLAANTLDNDRQENENKEEKQALMKLCGTGQ